MLAHTRPSRGCLVLLGLLMGAVGPAVLRVDAQQTSDGGYSVSEAGEAQEPAPVPPAGTQENTGPVRLARFAYLSGHVTWRTDETSDWSVATINMPLRQGAEITVSDGGRAEIQFDDGSLLRLGNGAVVTLQTLYSDSDGEFTEIKMTDGLASLRLRTDRSVYQVNTPLGSLKAAGPAGIRVGVGNGLEVAVQSGRATLEGVQGKADLQSGDFLDLTNADSPYALRDIPRADSWDQWNLQRDDVLSLAADAPETAHLPADVAIVAQDLNDYGTWHDDSQDGWVWCPSVTTVAWRPYQLGHWTWVNPFGWTWVSSEPWGWAPYHYGTWVYKPYGWAWCPGPVNQYWSPAVVHFSECNGVVAWCPLAPREVRYPSGVAFGFRAGNWAAFFSIGGAAVYYPTTAGYCAPRVFDTRYVNRVTYLANLGNGSASYQRFGLSQESYAANHNTYLSAGATFVPQNARVAAGVSAIASADFGGRISYIPVAKADTSLFVQGRAIAAPPQGSAPLAGPIAAKPTMQSLTPTRTFVQAPQVLPAIQARPVYRAPIADAVVRNSQPITPAGRVVTRTQSGYIDPRAGTTAPLNGYRSDRPGSNGATVYGNRGTGTVGQDPTRFPAPVRGNGTLNQDPVPGRYNTNPSAGTGKTAPSSSGTSSAADAAAAARASLGVGSRTRPTGSSADSTGSSDRSGRAPSYNGAGSPSSADRSPRVPIYNGASGAGSAGGGVDRSGSGYTPRAPQTAPPARSNPPAGQSNPGPSKDSGSGSGSKGSDTSKGSRTGN